MTLWLLVGALALVVGAGFSAYFLGRSDGKHAERSATVNRQLKAAEKIADATANAPVTRDDLLKRLRDTGL